jgi:hypothetical protein
MQASHGANCLQGCLSSSTVHTGLVVRFNSPNIYDLALPTISEQLAVVLRSPEGNSGVTGGQELYHCVPVQ